MPELQTTGFLIEIDGYLQGFYDEIGAAKDRAAFLGKGVSSIKLTSYGEPGPNSAWYWDYEVDGWLFSHDAVLCDPKRLEVQAV